jgi:hypothetical protein
MGSTSPNSPRRGNVRSNSAASARSQGIACARRADSWRSSHCSRGRRSPNLKRLFGTRDGFDANVRGMLEYRLAQVLEGKIDPALRNYVQSAVRDIEPDPELSLAWVRSIANRAMALIWEAELPSDQRLPDAWIYDWKQGGQRLPWLNQTQRLPPGKGQQCNVLRLMTGADNIRPVANSPPSRLRCSLTAFIGRGLRTTPCRLPREHRDERVCGVRGPLRDRARRESCPGLAAGKGLRQRRQGRS